MQENGYLFKLGCHSGTIPGEMDFAWQFTLSASLQLFGIGLMLAEQVSSNYLESGIWDLFKDQRGAADKHVVPLPWHHLPNHSDNGIAVRSS